MICSVVLSDPSLIDDISIGIFLVKDSFLTRDNDYYILNKKGIDYYKQNPDSPLSKLDKLQLRLYDVTSAFKIKTSYFVEEPEYRATGEYHPATRVTPSFNSLDELLTYCLNHEIKVRNERGRQIIKQTKYNLNYNKKVQEFLNRYDTTRI